VGPSIVDENGQLIADASVYDPNAEYDWGSPSMLERELGIIQ